jgi:hypothetical protein
MKSGLRFGGSRSCWRLEAEAEAAPQNKLVRSAEPHSQRGRLARDARRKALSAFTYSQPSQQVICRVASRKSSQE